MFFQLTGPQMPSSSTVTSEDGTDWILIAQIGTSFIISLGTLIFFYVKWYYVRSDKMREIELTNEANKPESEIGEGQDDFDVVVFHDLDKYSFKTFMEIHNQIMYLFDHTKITRFLILYAWGDFEGDFDQNNPPHKSVHFEEHKGVPTGSEVNEFNNVSIDQEYFNMMKQLSLFSPYKIDVDQYPESMLRSIYTQRGINESWVYKLGEKNLPDGRQRITYTSLATTDIEGISKVDHYPIRVTLDKLVSIIHKDESHE